MERVAYVMGMAALVLVAGGVTAQTTPNFSGRWTLAPDSNVSAPSTSSTPSGQAGSGQAASTGSGQAASRGSGQAGGRGAPGTMGSGWGADMTVTQDATSLTLEWAQFARGDMQPPMKFAYLLNGSESKNTINMGRGPQEQISKTTWNGAKLIITTVHSFRSPQSGQIGTSEIKQVLSLESATSLVVETTRSGVMGGPASTTKTVYRKN